MRPAAAMEDVGNDLALGALAASRVLEALFEQRPELREMRRQVLWV